MLIKDLFDPARDIHRAIEKVITYKAAQQERLKAEITEYVVTESLEDQIERLLSKMQAALEMGGENEIGVWVSGFYGSGKSSFTKYLGLALDESVQVDGVPFLKHLQDRLQKPQTKALLGAMARQNPAAVILLDLASEMVAGATMEEVSTVLYYKVLQYAGYSRNLKVAALERKMKRDGRFDEFTGIVEEQLGVPWNEVQNDPLVVDSIIPEIAHKLYPEFFKTPTSFSTETSDFFRFENERVEEMIDIIREATGKQFIIFIVDEVGQYVGSRLNLILNLDGLAKNFKNVGDGKVWIVGTAQQTLTEDDPRAALNSPEIYRLKDRFPIQIDLESSDIKEICYRRLLGKSSQGEQALGSLFDKHGQALRHNTKLQDAKFYDADFSKQTFVNLYPFLPAHFDILLHLLGALAKSTGGIGLRSAIKVLQDILVEGAGSNPPVAEQSLGWLATTVTLYDSLEKDIRRAFLSIHNSVQKVLIRFPDSALHQDIAKTVAVLQILNNLPVTPRNVAALMHPSVDGDSIFDKVNKAIEDLVSDPIVPFGEKDGALCFFSEKLNDIDQERAQIPLRTIETRRIFNEALRDTFTPLPRTQLHGSLAVSSGLKAKSGSMVTGLAGERDTVQTVVEFVEAGDYETARTRAVDESRERSSLSTVFLLGRVVPEINEKIAESYRCHEIANRYRNDPDQEIKEYCNNQADRATRLAQEVQHLMKRSLVQGSFIFRGQTTAVHGLDQDLLDAAKKYLAEVADQVFDRYSEAPVRAETSLAERLLRLGNLRAVTKETDPLGLVEIVGGNPQINTKHKALLSIKDFIERHGSVEGRRLIDYFTGAPFGWSQDTLRYLVAALLLAGEVKLRVGGREVTVTGQQAIDALRTNNSFKTVGVSLRDDRPSMEVLARASKRLTELSGDTVVPLEEEISKAASKLLLASQHRLGSLAERLDRLSLPGVERVRDLNDEMADILASDSSDAPSRFGAEESPLFDTLNWASELDKALKNGLDRTVESLQRHKQEIQSLPGTGVPGKLRDDLDETFVTVADHLAKDDFHKHTVDLNSALTSIESRTCEAAAQMADSQAQLVKEAQEDLQRVSEWGELTQEEQSQVLNDFDQMKTEATPDLDGLKTLLRRQIEIQAHSSEQKAGIVKRGQERQRQRLEEEKAKAKKSGQTKLTREIRIPGTLTNSEELEVLIRELQALRNELAIYSEIEVKVKIQD